MRVLVTGHWGKVGRAVAAELTRRHIDWTGFDAVDGHDIRDISSLRAAAKGCDAIIHLAVIQLSDRPPPDLYAVNVHGTENVLQTAVDLDISRVIHMSTINLLGIDHGQGKPLYLPLNEQHPATPRNPYAISKRLAEELCRRYSEAFDLTTICLRPPFVWEQSEYAALLGRPWFPEYGMFIDSRDLATAAAQALTCPATGNHVLLVSGPDVALPFGAQEQVRRLPPGVEWRGGSKYTGRSRRTLIDISRAQHFLGWTPVHAWTAAYPSMPVRVLRRLLRRLSGAKRRT